MPTKPPTDLFDRDISKALVREWIDVAIPMIQEVVNHGVAAFTRCLTTAKGGDENLAILMPYLHLLEMTDAVEILLAEAAPIPAQVQLRSTFEALLTIEYITKAAAPRRAFAYLVADIHRRLASWRAMDPNTPEGRRGRERIATDAYTQDMRIPDIPDIRARIENLETLLQKPDWREANVEYRRLKKILKRRPAWYQLYDGPKNLEELATHLGWPAHYDILYRPWSEAAHAHDAVYRKLTEGAKGEPAIHRVRDTSEFGTVVSLVVTFTLRATRRILSFYRPEELPAYKSWYLREVRESFMRFLPPGSEEDPVR